jgi:hypothetical protein
MALLAPMSDLDAVNRMLASLGGSPVNTLDVAGVGDVADAKRHLTETLRDVETVGYSWNSDTSYPLTPDPTTGAILIPEGALDIDATDQTVNVVERVHPTLGQRALYDADNRTFDFSATYTADAPLNVDIIWGFEFNDIPQPARTYIATAAARRFQAQKINSTILDHFDEEDEMRAFLLLQRYERRSRDTNSFRRSASLQKWTGRRALG